MQRALQHLALRSTAPRHLCYSVCAAAQGRAWHPARSPCERSRRPFSTSKITGFDVRSGDLLEIDSTLWRVEKAEFSRRAQGAANVQLYMRHFTNGTKKEVRLSSTETVQKAVLDGTAHVTFLYKEGENLLVMDSSTYEQTELPLGMLGESARFLQEGMALKVESYKGKPVIVVMPDRAEFEVKEVEEARETATAGGVTAVLANGVRVRLPKHVRAGDKVIIYTGTGEYCSKA